MKVFFDTSSLVKLYHKESGTQELMEFFQTNFIESIYLSEITKIELTSTVWKKCRNGEIDETIAKKLIDKFSIDSAKYSYVPDSFSLKIIACELIEKYWKKGLRTLDTLQLASGLKVKDEIEFYFTSDTILKKLAEAEGIKTK